jgi:hypothetical protein
MASTRSKADAKPIPLDAFGRDVVRRREAAGELQMPRNSGTRRTPSKRALLKAIEESGGDW